MTPVPDAQFRAALASSLTGLAVILFAMSLQLASVEGLPLLASLAGLILAFIGGAEMARRTS